MKITKLNPEIENNIKKNMIPKAELRLTASKKMSNLSMFDRQNHMTAIVHPVINVDELITEIMNFLFNSLMKG